MQVLFSRFNQKFAHLTQKVVQEVVDPNLFQMEQMVLTINIKWKAMFRKIFKDLILMKPQTQHPNIHGKNHFEIFRMDVNQMNWRARFWLKRNKLVA